MQLENMHESHPTQICVEMLYQSQKVWPTTSVLHEMSFSVLLITVEGMRPPTPLVAAPNTKFEMHDIGMHIVLASKNQREIDYPVKYFMIRLNCLPMWRIVTVVLCIRAAES